MQLSSKGIDVLVIEQHHDIGLETSARHSEVIHGIIHFPQDSLKSRWCVAGNKLLYQYCLAHNIPFKKIGKLIVATSDAEREILNRMYASALANGITDVELLDQARTQQLEPNVAAVGALYSPSTGIIDTKQYLRSLAEKNTRNHGAIMLNTQFISANVIGDRVVVNVQSGAQQQELQAKCLINAAGLHATKVAQAISGLNVDEIPTTYYRKGNYFNYLGDNPFQHLIYPVPIAGGLGIHCTIDLAGKLRFGPDVQDVNQIDYTVDATRQRTFYQAVQKYWSHVQEDLLQPAYSGIRPVLSNTPGVFKDFSVMRHNLGASAAQVFGLYGIESPGLTCSLAIGNWLADNVGLALVA